MAYDSQSKMNTLSRRAMSIEAAMEQDRLEIVKSLQAAKPSKSGKRGQRTSSGAAIVDDEDDDTSHTDESRSPIRSMLDLDDDTLSPYGPPSASSNGNKIKPARAFKNALDTNIALISPTHTAQTSPIEYFISRGQHPRSHSDASTRPGNLVPRPHGDRIKGDKASSFQFSDYEPASTNAFKSPKRNSSVSRRINPSSMAEAMRGSLEGYLSDGGRRGRHSISGSKLSSYGGGSKSPSGFSESNHRSRSPGPSILKQYRALSLEDGTPIEEEKTNRILKPRLEDDTIALVKEGRLRTNSIDALSTGLARMENDYDSGVDSDAMEESSDEEGSRSSDEDGVRGRRKASKDLMGDKTPRTLLEAEERTADDQITIEEKKYSAKAILEPEITITGPAGDRSKGSKPGVHPMNAFDQEGSGHTPVDSDTEADISDIKRAQKLAVIMTPIVSTPKTNRCVRTIYRGDFGKMQREAEDNSRRVRKYLVATDLSEEAAHALEWTVGTVLRDGDTLLCIYCVDEEIGIGEATEGSVEAGIATQAESLASLANTPQNMHVAGSKIVSSSPFSPGIASRTTSPAPSPAGRSGFRAEAERFKAVEDITLRVSRLLRKTRLQVRVVIEVIHCKSPRHLITEVIDYLTPTLVILGSRGRSALKGVILGSFSNYLVTKSSVPVMVARKKLRKHTKYKRPPIKLANNLTNVSGRSLAAAKVD